MLRPVFSGQKSSVTWRVGALPLRGGGYGCRKSALGLEDDIDDVHAVEGVALALAGQ